MFGQLLTQLWPLIDVRILFMLNILWISLWISIKFFYMHWYWQDVDLDDWIIFFVHFHQSYDTRLMSKFCLCSISYGPIDGFWLNFVNALIYWQNVGKDTYKLFFVIFQLSYGLLLMSESYFHLISWEQIDGFWWNCVHAVLWLTHELFLNFSTELWPLIDVKISIAHFFPELFNRVMTLDWF